MDVLYTNTSYSNCVNCFIDLEKALTQSDVATVVNSDIQSSGCQEQQTDVTEAIPVTNNSNDNVSALCSTDANAGISGNNVPTSHLNLDASSALLESPAGGKLQYMCMYVCSTTCILKYLRTMSYPRPVFLSKSV